MLLIDQRKAPLQTTYDRVLCMSRAQVELKNKDDWVKINAGQHTLMRVLYTPEMMKRLERGVRDRTLTPEVRRYRRPAYVCGQPKSIQRGVGGGGGVCNTCLGDTCLGGPSPLLR